jgi:hypothetical protein
MKTPMQELVEEMEQSPLMFAPALALIKEKNFLEKEKEQMCEFADEFAIECINFHHEKTMSQENFFDLTFNTNEK